MDKELELYKSVASLIFPTEFLRYFNIVSVDQIPSTDDLEGTVVFHFEEKDDLRCREEGHTYRPNGFYESSSIRDFPLRDKKVFLDIKRRRWIDTTTQKSVGNTYELAAYGTRHSKEFAAFLKETLGQVPDSGFFA